MNASDTCFRFGMRAPIVAQFSIIEAETTANQKENGILGTIACL